MSQDTVRTLAVRVDNHDRLFETHADDNKEIWKTIDRIKSRPPVWATAVISVLTALVGGFVGGFLG